MSYEKKTDSHRMSGVPLWRYRTYRHRQSAGATSRHRGSGEPILIERQYRQVCRTFNDFNDKSDFEDWTLVNTNPCFSWKWNQYSGYEYTPCIEMKQDSDDGFGTASDN